MSEDEHTKARAERLRPLAERLAPTAIAVLRDIATNAQDPKERDRAARSLVEREIPLTGEDDDA